jgi:hypothetical protein
MRWMIVIGFTSRTCDADVTLVSRYIEGGRSEDTDNNRIPLFQILAVVSLAWRGPVAVTNLDQAKHVLPIWTRLNFDNATS